MTDDNNVSKEAEGTYATATLLTPVRDSTKDLLQEILAASLASTGKVLMVKFSNELLDGTPRKYT